MGRVTVASPEPVPALLRDFTSFFWELVPPTHVRELDAEAIQEAVDTLGIEVDVTVVPWMGNYFVAPAVGLTVPPEASPELGREGWVVYVSQDLPAGARPRALALAEYRQRQAEGRSTERTEESGFDHVLWHELGHVKDLQHTTPEFRRADVRASRGAEGRLDIHGDDEMYDAYVNSRAERVADEIAERYAPDHPLAR